MRFIKIIFIGIIIFLLYLFIDNFNHKKSKNITEPMSNGILNRRVSFADENNQPLETFIRFKK